MKHGCRIGYLHRTTTINMVKFYRGEKSVSIYTLLRVGYNIYIFALLEDMTNDCVAVSPPAERRIVVLGADGKGIRLAANVSQT